MRFLGWLFFFATIALGGLLAYLYSFELVPLKNALRELEAENERLLQLKLESTGGEEEGGSQAQLLSYPTDKLFRPGTAELSPAGKALLRELVPELKDAAEIVVACYTDSTPVKTNRDKFPTNWELAAARASAVVRFFIEEGVPPEKLSAVSYGDTRPVAPNSTPEGQAQNRRLEIRVR